jgi:hypothetical protein
VICGGCTVRLADSFVIIAKGKLTTVNDEMKDVYFGEGETFTATHEMICRSAESSVVLTLKMKIFKRLEEIEARVQRLQNNKFKPT